MKYLIALILTFCSFFLLAQEKGLKPVTENPQTETGSTFAVVVGISNYQDEGIPDLLFADKDAEAFAAFLQSPAGGSLDEDHLKVLLNEKATMAQFAIALDWLMEVAKENDRVIIYFSGHGDVEKKTLTQPGFLLCWDAPSRVYMAGGAFGLAYLQEVVSTLSVQTKAKTIVITDACRSGKLSGSKVGGAQLTNSNLAKQYANEIKILSCQPDEYSIEGEQWGGGRGAFSYHLLDGLTGMADGNVDQTVNLKEIGRYLEDKVTEEVAPQSQNPMVIGNKTEKLADVFPELLAQLKEGKKGQLQLFTATELRGIEDEVLAAADSNIVEMYLAFQKAIDENRFLEPAEACADFYYEKLSQEPQLEKLHSSMRRNYAAALQDDAQQVLNKLLKSDHGENAKNLSTISRDYKQFPKNLKRAADLLGDEHYMFRVIMARSYWFKGYINDESRCDCKNISNAKKIIPYYQKALTYQPEMPHVWAQLAAVYGIQKSDFDSAEYYAELAIAAVPDWTLVHHWMANAYLNSYDYSNNEKHLIKSKEWLDKGLKADSNSVAILNELAYWYNLNQLYENEQSVLDRSLAIDPIAQTVFFKGLGYKDWGKYEKAEKSFLQAISMDSSFFYKTEGLLTIYSLTNQQEKLKQLLDKYIASDFDQSSLYFQIVNQAEHSAFIKYAEEFLKLQQKAIKLDPENLAALGQAPLLASYLNDFENAQTFIAKAIKLDSTINTVHRAKGTVLCRKKQYKAAKKAFQTALQLAPSNYRTIMCLFMVNVQLREEKEAYRNLNLAMKYNAVAAASTLYRYPKMLTEEKLNECFAIMKKLYPESPDVHFHHAIYLTLYEKNKEAAFSELEVALQKGFTNFRELFSTNFSLLREDTDRWNKLSDNYFSKIYKK